MTFLNRAQRRALKAVFDRAPIYPNGDSAAMIVQRHGWVFTKTDYRDLRGNEVWYWRNPAKPGIVCEDARPIVAAFKYATPLTYRQFRKQCVSAGWDCVMVSWYGMWLGIEKDGYTHS